MTTAVDEHEPAGTFVVHDPALRDQIAALLAPFRTACHALPRAAAAKESSALKDAQQRIAELETSSGQTQDLLAQSIAALAAERESHDETTGKLVAAESDLAQTARELEKARADVAGGRTALDRARADLTELRAEINTRRSQAPAARPAPLQASRAKDRDAFATLARRMEDQAASQSKSVGDILRIAARAVRDEVAKVYGEPAKAAS